MFTFNSGQQIQPRWLNELIRLLASLSNIPVDRYLSHSLRIGAATTVAAASIPDWCILGLGRWSSDCYQRYIRLPSSGTGNIARLLDQSYLTPARYTSALPTNPAIHIWAGPYPTYSPTTSSVQVNPVTWCTASLRASSSECVPHIT